MKIFDFCIVLIFTFVISKKMKNKIFKEGHTMEDITDRLAHILRAKNLTATKFAELMGIQPSNVSHLLNGRNKPSLEFLTKLKEVFPEYSFDWIIMGKKPITINEPSPVTSENQQMKFDDEPQNNMLVFDEDDDKKSDDEPIITEKIIDKQENATISKTIDKLIVVYSDKTFEILSSR